MQKMFPKEIKITRVEGECFDRYKIEFEMCNKKHKLTTKRLDIEEVCDLLITNILDRA